MAGDVCAPGEDDPYADYAFEVLLDGSPTAGFTEVSGLEMEMGTVPYREGGVDDHVHQLPGQFDHAALELRRGMTDDAAFWEWLQSVMGGTVTRKPVVLELTDPAGATQVRWRFREAYPTAWRGPDLTSRDGGVAIESIELTYSRFERL